MVNEQVFISIIIIKQQFEFSEAWSSLITAWTYQNQPSVDDINIR